MGSRMSDASRLISSLDANLHHRRDSAAMKVARGIASLFAEAPDDECEEHKQESKGCWHRLLHEKFYRDSVIECGMGITIFLNAVCIGVSADWNRDNRLAWAGVDSIFAVIFIAERVYKLRETGCFEYSFGPNWRWNMFETLLAVMAVVELYLDLGEVRVGIPTSVVRFVRLFRIVKIFRILRLEFFRELMLMVNGVVYGSKTLMWSILLIAITLYVIALVMRETAGEHYSSTDYEHDVDGSGSFRNLPTAFFTVFRCVVAGDCDTPTGQPIFVLLTAKYGAGYAVVYCTTLLLMQFGLFNVIVAIYVENTVAAAKYNEMSQMHRRLMDKDLFFRKMEEMLRLILELGRAGAPSSSPKLDLLKLSITPELLDMLMHHDRFREILAELDVPGEDQIDLFETLDVDKGGHLDVEEFITGIAKLRGDPRRADVVGVGLMLSALQTCFQEFEVSTRVAFEEQRKTIDQLRFELRKFRSRDTRTLTAKMSEDLGHDGRSILGASDRCGLGVVVV